MVAGAAVMAMLLVAACYGSRGLMRGQPVLPPLPDPTDFVAVIDNPYFPLIPGTTFIYDGEEDGIPIHEEFTVTHDTKMILGVTVTVIRDEVFTDGVLFERAFDWHAQDVFGNVWYFGEDTAEFDAEGNIVSTEGSWEAGVNGAQPGIIMEADPEVGDTYFQEFAPDVAVDAARVLSVTRRVSIDFGDFDDVLLTKEWSTLEHGFIEHKYYALDKGLILIVAGRGGNERVTLTDIVTE